MVLIGYLAREMKSHSNTLSSVPRVQLDTAFSGISLKERERHGMTTCHTRIWSDGAVNAIWQVRHTLPATVDGSTSTVHTLHELVAADSVQDLW